MTETIGIRLVELCRPVLQQFYLSQAASEVYPYATYDCDTTPYYDKDGVYKYQASTIVRVVSDRYTEAADKAEAIVSAIASGMHEGTHIASAPSRRSDCREGIWTIELQYTIKQVRQ